MSEHPDAFGYRAMLEAQSRREGDERIDVKKLAEQAGVDGMSLGAWWIAGKTPPATILYSAPAVAAMLALVRREALEEAAKVAESKPIRISASELAAAIRALKPETP